MNIHCQTYYNVSILKITSINAKEHYFSFTQTPTTTILKIKFCLNDYIIAVAYVSLVY